MMTTEENLPILLQDPDQRRNAFGSMVAMYSEKLYWQIRRMVLSHDDANDVLQNVFLKAWSSIENFRGDSKLSTWLYKIAINESLTFLSKINNHPTSSLDGEAEIMANRLESDSYTDGDAIELKLQKAILTLPEKQRLVFQLRYYEEMKYEEMSELLNTSIGALKASYHHAAKKIEDYLTAED